MKKCPYCAEEIQDEAIICRFCGRPMPGHKTRAPEPIQLLQENLSSTTSKKPYRLMAGIAAPATLTNLAREGVFDTHRAGDAACQVPLAFPFA